MKAIAFILSFLFFTCSFAQKNSKDLVGYFQGAEKNSIFKFYKSGEKYIGKLVWMKRPERKDTMNPDVSKRHKKILGSIVVYGFIYDGKNIWKGGYVYDANKGKTYQGIIIQDEKGNITMRGFLGIPILGKSEYFEKVNFKE